ncbi:unnamed protein product [Effrenium voratum]|nr:unnamed protein product [Effrenium voratum]
MAGELRLIKVPRWLSEKWLSSQPNEVVADLDLDTNTLRLRGAGVATLQVERRASPELFSFWLPGKDSRAPADGEVPIEGPILEALSVRPDLKDTGYRNLLQQRTEETASASGRSRHEEKIIQGDERPKVTRSAAPAKAPEASFEEVLSVVEAALKAAGPAGLTGMEIFEKLPTGGCSLAQLRDALLALAVPSLEGGSRRYKYAPCLGRAKSGKMMRWSGGDADYSDEARITTGHLRKRPRAA